MHPDYLSNTYLVAAGEGGPGALVDAGGPVATVADELEHNRFVRLWRGLDEEGTGSCTAFGDPATLVLLGDDYDGGHKAWVRWPDGRDDLVPGSQVRRT